MDNKKNKSNTMTLEDLFNDVIDIKSNLLEKSNSDSLFPNPDLYMYYKDLQNRIIWLDDVVNEITAIPITKMILNWNKEDETNNISVEKRKPIKIFIYKVSAGLDILISGHKRFALKNSKALYHSGSAGIQGTAEQIQSQTAQYSKQLDMLNNRLLERTKISKDLLKKKKKSEWFIVGQEQAELGIVDEIIDNISELF